MKLFFKIWAVFLFSFLFLFAGKSDVLAAPPANFQTNQVIGTGLNGPSGFEIAPDGRIFILERTGKIKIVKNGQLLATPFADLPSVASGDRGLIGIAFDPEFGVNNHYVYFYYTGTDLLNRLVRFNADGDVGTNGPFLIYQTNSPSQELHVGGSIRFGPDGKMYFAVGDNGYPPNAQNLGNPHGKILRINKDGSIPLDNPFYGQPGALPEIWAYGMRNPWRFQFDSATGELYGGDVGDYTWEEVNHIQKGQNYGWPNFEGYCNTLCGATKTPIYAYNHDGESAAVTGGPVYRSNMFPAAYQGSLFFGDYAKGFIKRAPLDGNGNATSIIDFDLNAGSVVDLKVAPDGSMYYITYFPGRLYRVSYSTGNQAPTANASANNTKGVEPFTVNFSSAGSSDPTNDPLTYLWKFGDGTTSNQANPVKTYNVKGTYTVELAVSDGVNTSNAVPLVIQVGVPPTVNIGEPADGSNYRAGDTVHWTASSLDGAGFDINDNNLKTEIILHHHTHIHPFLGPITGRQGTFTIPTTGEASADTWFEIKVTATDTNGLSTTKSNFIYPIKTNMTFASNVPGLTFYLDGAPHATPFVVEGVEKFEREISVPTIQLFNGKYYQFDHWSDNGAPKHFIVTPEADTTYTAFFTEAPAYQAQYFNNTDLAGAPAVTRQDAKIDFVWGEGSPAQGVNADQFSVRWVKNQYFAAGRYKFTTATDDGVRLFIDGNPLINEWHGNNASFNATVDLAAGNHEIRMEFLELFGLANARLEYDLTTDQPVQPPATGYAAQYFNNKTLAGQPVLARNEAIIDNTWAGGSPDPLVTVDNFSARWTKTENLVAGTYEFTATADDGVRVKVDGETIIDKFIDQGTTTYKASKALAAGNHTIVVEYYEAGGDAVAKFSFVKTADAPTTNGFAGEYFNNKTLAGAPALTRNDAVVNFDWGAGSPDPIITPDNFSARWTKTEAITAATAGTYEFTATGDDGVRVKVDGETIIDKFIDQGTTTYKANKALAAGNHTIVFEYYENGGAAVAKFSYVKVNDAPPPAGSFAGEYFANKTLAGAPVLTRNDAAVNFDWGAGSPDPVLPNDNYSARWTKTETFAAGTYEFSVTGDDGIRLKIDNEILIDKFIDQAPTTYKASKTLAAGNHTIVIEYYENGGGATAKFSYAATATPPPATGYTGEYFNNKDLLAPVVLTRTDAAINFDWAGGSPDALINANNFSARWTKTENFTEAGDYEFTVTADDGIRVKVDGAILIDKFIDQGPTTYKATKTLTAGNHTLVIEYYENGGGAVAKFSFAKVTGGQTPPPTGGCPTGWTCQDIGATAQAGSTVFANNIYTLKGSGWDIWAADDMFHSAFQNINGDATIIARVTSQTNTNPWAKAGVMIKETATAGAKYVSMAVTPTNGYRMQYNFTGEALGGAYTFPNAWVKLTRGGNVFNTYTSADGVTWTPVGNTNLVMTPDVKIGLFVTSHDNNQLCTVTFDNVSITPGVH